MECAAFRGRVAFGWGTPGTALENAFALGFNPRSHPVQYVMALFVDCPVRTLWHVNQQVAVFADDVHQGLDDLVLRFVYILDIVIPIAKTGVGLPGMFCRAIE